MKVPFLPSRPAGSTLTTPSANETWINSVSFHRDAHICTYVRMQSRHWVTHRLLPLNPHGPQSLSSPSTEKSAKKRKAKNSHSHAKVTRVWKLFLGAGRATHKLHSSLDLWVPCNDYIIEATYMSTAAGLLKYPGKREKGKFCESEYNFTILFTFSLTKPKLFLPYFITIIQSLCFSISKVVLCHCFYLIHPQPTGV